MITKISNKKISAAIFAAASLLGLQIAVSAFFINPVQTSATASLFPFSDNFDGSDSANFAKWTASDSNWSIKGGSPHSSSKKAGVKGGSGDHSLSKSISSFGYKNLVLSFWYKVEKDLESSDHFTVEWSNDGLTWNPLDDFSGLDKSSWVSKTYNLTSGADNSSGFRFRFRAHFSSNNDVVSIDDVNLSASPIPTGSISGMKFSDLNGDEIKNGEEAGLANWEIKISGTVASTTATDMNGNYSFNNLSDGVYLVCETPKDAWHETLPTGAANCMNGTRGYSVTVTNGNSITAKDFGNTEFSHLIVHKITNPENDPTQFFINLSGNGYVNSATAAALTATTTASYTLTTGAYSISENANSGWATTENNCMDIVVGAGITVDCNITNTKLGSITLNKNTSPSNVIGTFPFTITGTATSSTKTLVGTGSLVFDNLLPGNYTLSEVVPDGWDQTDSSCGGSYTLAPGENTVCNFTNTKRSSVTITKIADPTTGPFVFVLSGATASSTATYADGTFGNNTKSYTFENLLPGSGYSLTENLPEGWSGSTISNCTLGEISINPESFTLPSGTNISCSFNNTQYSLITGKKFNDQNNSGVNDNEPAITGWTITLTDSAGVATTTETDANGTYSFSNLLPGTYKVCEVSRAGWKESYPKSGTECGNDITGYNLELTAGHDLIGNDFGNYQPGKIIIYKWQDLNTDGVWQKGPSENLVTTNNTLNEPPVASWTIGLGKIGQAKEGHTLIPIEIVAMSLTGGNGSAELPINMPGNYRAFETTKAGWQTKNPAPHTDSFFDIFCNLKDCDGRTFNKNSFFDIFIDNLSGQEITKDGNDKPLEFGNAWYSEALGLKLAPLSGNASSTQSATLLESKTLELPVEGGTSTVAIIAGTIISTTDGTTTIDISSITLSSIATGTLSNLGTGTVLDGSLQWGITELGLSFSQPIALKIFVGNAFNGQTLNIVRSTSASSGWTNDGISPATCVVADGLCSFTATKASYYAVDHTPTPPPADSGSGSGSSGGNGGGSSGGSSVQLNSDNGSPVQTNLSDGGTSAPSNNAANGTPQNLTPETIASLNTQLESAKQLLQNMLPPGGNTPANPITPQTSTAPTQTEAVNHNPDKPTDAGTPTNNAPSTDSSDADQNAGFAASLINTLGSGKNIAIIIATLVAALVAIFFLLKK